MQHEFGGPWTEEKLDHVSKYLHAYTTLMTSNPTARLYFQTVYVDAYAGSGYRTDPQHSSSQLALIQDELDTPEWFEGSIIRALKNRPSFDQFIFVENNHSRNLLLQNLKAEFPDQANKISIIEEDSNIYLTDWCKKTKWKSLRAVVFLDPYGMQVEWSTIEAIAATKSIDMWYLFSNISRLLPSEGPPRQQWADVLTRVLGTTSWQDVFYPTQLSSTLFGNEEQQSKDASIYRIRDFLVTRLKTLFPGVAENPWIVRNSKGSPLFLLCFACANKRFSRCT
jgi:three-Cys-motif partner protein